MRSAQDDNRKQGRAAAHSIRNTQTEACATSTRTAIRGIATLPASGQRAQLFVPPFCVRGSRVNKLRSDECDACGKAASSSALAGVHDADRRTPQKRQSRSLTTVRQRRDRVRDDSPLHNVGRAMPGRGGSAALQKNRSRFLAPFAQHANGLGMTALYTMSDALCQDAEGAPHSKKTEADSSRRPHNTRRGSE